MRADLNQTYPGGSGSTLRYDFFRPDSDELVPLVVCIHGGGWISGEKEGMREVAVALVQNGFAAACPQYRLAPLHTCPAAIDDVQAFVRFMRAQFEAHAVDPNRIASLGNSAGGHLATMLGVTDEDGSRVQAVVDICGITDVTRPREQHLPISWSFLEQFMGVAYEDQPDAYRAASPLYLADEQAPPFLVIHGEDDDVVPVEQSEALVKTLQEKNIPVEYHRLAGEGHSFTLEAWLRIEQLYTSFLLNHFSYAQR